MHEVEAWQVPPPWSPVWGLIGPHIQREANKDLLIRSQVEAMTKRLPRWLYAQLKCGSEFQMASILRSFLFEYADRMLKHGIHVLPSSFNLVESFLQFDRSVFLFGLREEREHLLDLTDYFEWYERAEVPQDPTVLIDVMTEGCVYSYDMTSQSQGYRLQGLLSEFVIAGISLARHRDELTCFLLAGENPPEHSDGVATKLWEQVQFQPEGKDRIEPNPELSTKDRYLTGHPTFVKVIALLRIDLRSSGYDVRYVLEDVGQSYFVTTDDELYGVPPEEVSRLHNPERFKRYDALISALATLIYLPVAFIALADRTHDISFNTPFGSQLTEKPAQEMLKILGEASCPTTRTLKCLQSARVADLPTSREIQPPELEFHREGYWKTLAPGEVGKDAQGNQVAGRTWVTRHESWSASSASAFVLNRTQQSKTGKDPGTVYVMRSGAHEVDLYKIGLTRRTAEVRAKELGRATGVPLPFGVLHHEEVGDCAAVEQEIHKRLDSRRVNPSREFFLGPLSEITSVIIAVIRDLEGS